MSEAEREKWDHRYAEGSYQPRTWPSPFVESWLAKLPPAGRALDIACGTGRNALRLAEAGYAVDAMDISAVAVETAQAEASARDLNIDFQIVDLDNVTLEPEAYDLITVIRYRNTDLWSKLIDALSPNGWLLIEHHFKTTSKVDGPKEPSFRLDPQELLRVFAALRVVSYEEVLETGRDTHPYALQRMAACKGDPGF